jgi:hypothetical protein
MTRHPWLAIALLLSLGTLAWRSLSAAPAPAPAAPAATSAAPAGDSAVGGAAIGDSAPSPAAAADRSAATVPPAQPVSAVEAAPAGGGVSAAAAAGETPGTDLGACSSAGLQGPWRAGYWFGIALLAMVIVKLASATPLLRDRGPGSPWSLGRTQMAWWFFFVICAYVHIWLVTDRYTSLTTSVLALIGISAGTALAGAVIDDGKQNQLLQKPMLEDTKGQLQKANTHLVHSAAAAAAGVQAEAAMASLPALQSNFSMLKDIDAQLAQMPTKQPTRNSFWLDLLSDENGISFHRFQMVIWTLVLTAVFVSRVICTQRMPDFDANLLGLMGISSGAYIGFKFPEKQA